MAATAAGALLPVAAAMAPNTAQKITAATMA
jgi:hypothetical protein